MWFHLSGNCICCWWLVLCRISCSFMVLCSCLSEPDQWTWEAKDGVGLQQSPVWKCQYRTVVYWHLLQNLCTHKNMRTVILPYVPVSIRALCKHFTSLGTCLPAAPQADFSPTAKPTAIWGCKLPEHKHNFWHSKKSQHTSSWASGCLFNCLSLFKLID